MTKTMLNGWSARSCLKRICVVIALWVSAAVPARAGDLSGSVHLPSGKSPEDTVVFISGVRAAWQPPLAAPQMDAASLRFLPHVLTIVKGQTVVFPNTDQARHNIFSLSKVHRFNLGIYPPGVKKEELFDRPGVVSILCNVHPEMSAFIVVADSAYYAQVKTDGHFEIKGIPPGKYDVVAWHEGYGEFRQGVDLSGAATTLDISLKKN